MIISLMNNLMEIKKKKKRLILKFFHIPCPPVLMISASPVLLAQEDSNLSRLALSKSYLPSVCAGLQNRNKSHLPPCINQQQQPLTAMLLQCSWHQVPLLKATRWGRTWVMRGAPLCPGSTRDRCIVSDLTWKPLSSATELQSTARLPPENGWDDGWSTLLGL